MEPDKPDTVCQMRLSGSDLHGTGQRVSQKDLSQLTGQIVVWTEQLRYDPLTFGYPRCSEHRSQNSTARDL
jgi:hypothetical protein